MVCAVNNLTTLAGLGLLSQGQEFDHQRPSSPASAAALPEATWCQAEPNIARLASVRRAGSILAHMR